MKFLTSPWMTLPAGAVVYLAASLFFWRTPAPVPKPAAPDHVTQGAVVSWEFTNPEADQLMEELRTEKKSLAAREQQLNDLAARLDAERAEVNQVTQTVHQAQMDFDKQVLRVQEEEVANLKKLAKVYAAMTPDSAANIMAELEDPAIGKIMLFMKDPETAAVLESLAKKGPTEAKRAAGISERLRVSTFRNAANTAAK